MNAQIAAGSSTAPIRRSELRRLATTIDSGPPEFLACSSTGGISGGPTEAMNLLIEKIKRVGHCFADFEGYCLRLLLPCGVD